MLGFIYFLLSLLLLYATLGAVAPRRLGVRLALLVSVPAILVEMLLPQIIFLGLFITFMVSWGGGLEGTLGKLGLALHLVSWVLLAYNLRRMHRTYPILDGEPVLDEGPVSSDWQSREDNLRVSLLPYVGIGRHARRAVEVTRSVCFREVGGLRLKLDVYRPRQAVMTRDGRRPPSIIYIHGGAWTVGNRRQSPHMMFELAAAGHTVFAISYRLAPQHPLPAAIEDCKAAVAWVREHGPEYGGTRDAVVIGGSAGGHLTAMLALTPNDPRFQPGFESADTHILAAIPLYGAFDFVSKMESKAAGFARWLFEDVVIKKRYQDDPEHFHMMEPWRHVSKAAPPTLIVHGQSDSLVSINDSRLLYNKLSEAGARVHIVEIPDAQHAFELSPTPLHQRTMRIIKHFIDTLPAAQ